MASLPGSDTAILVLSYGSDLHNLYADTSKQNAARFRSKWPRSKKNFDADDFSPPSISKYEKGGLVFAQGQPAGRGFFIQKGKVKITVTSLAEMVGLGPA